MKISEYQKKFEDLFNLLESEHGNVKEITIKPSLRYEIPGSGVSETIVDCSITFSKNVE